MKPSRKLIKRLAACVCGLIGLLAAFAVNAATVDRVVGKVNDSIITLSEVEERAVALHSRLQGTPQGLTEKEALREALNMFIEEKLLIHEGKKRDITVTDEQLEKAVKGIQANNNISDENLKLMLEREGISYESYKNQIRNQILISQVRKALFENRVRIGDKRIRRYYKAHRNDFATRTKIHARHILFIFGEHLPDSAKRAKRQKARKVLKKIRAGADFIEMAKKHSEDVSASKGGDLGFLEEGKMVKGFQEAAFKLSADEVSPIVETPYGLHIIKVDEKVPGKVLTFKEAKNQIRAILKSQGMQGKYAKWIAELRKTAYIETSLFKKKKTRRPRKGIRQTASLPKEKPRSKTKNASLKPPSDKKASATSKRPTANKPAQKKTVRNGAGKKPDGGNWKLSTMEEKLIHIKALKDKKKISESEYQKRKKRLLKQL